LSLSQPLRQEKKVPSRKKEGNAMTGKAHDRDRSKGDAQIGNHLEKTGLGVDHLGKDLTKTRGGIGDHTGCCRLNRSAKRRWLSNKGYPEGRQRIPRKRPHRRFGARGTRELRKEGVCAFQRSTGSRWRCRPVVDRALGWHGRNALTTDLAEVQDRSLF